MVERNTIRDKARPMEGAQDYWKRAHKTEKNRRSHRQSLCGENICGGKKERQMERKEGMKKETKDTYQTGHRWRGQRRRFACCWWRQWRRKRQERHCRTPEKWRPVSVKDHTGKRRLSQQRPNDLPPFVTELYSSIFGLRIAFLWVLQSHTNPLCKLFTVRQKSDSW